MTFAEFWPEYVRAHSRPGTRIVHLIGTLGGWMILGAALVQRRWWWIAVALVFPYALAWISHFFVEHNRPASFSHPLWSWWADQRMVFLMLLGRMTDEVRRCAEMPGSSSGTTAPTATHARREENEKIKPGLQ